LLSTLAKVAAISASNPGGGGSGRGSARITDGGGIGGAGGGSSGSDFRPTPALLADKKASASPVNVPRFDHPSPATGPA